MAFPIDDFLSFDASVLRIPELNKRLLTKIPNWGQQLTMANISVVFNHAKDTSRLTGYDLLPLTKCRHIKLKYQII
jgi:hypothetical protein